jgi:hypothetical protein
MNSFEWENVVSTILGGLAIILVGYLIFGYFKNTSSIKVADNDVTQNRLVKLESLVADLDKQIGFFKNNQTATPASDVSLRLDKLERSYDVISNTILDNPERAISTKIIYDQQTFLKENLSNLKSDINKVNERLDSITNQMWGLLVGVLVSLIGFIFTNFLWNKRSETKM